MLPAIFTQNQSGRDGFEVVFIPPVSPVDSVPSPIKPLQNLAKCQQCQRCSPDKAQIWDSQRTPKVACNPKYVPPAGAGMASTRSNLDLQSIDMATDNAQRQWIMSVTINSHYIHYYIHYYIYRIYL